MHSECGVMFLRRVHLDSRGHQFPQVSIKLQDVVIHASVSFPWQNQESRVVTLRTPGQGHRSSVLGRHRRGFVALSPLSKHSVVRLKGPEVGGHLAGRGLASSEVDLTIPVATPSTVRKPWGVFQLRPGWINTLQSKNIGCHEVYNAEHMVLLFPIGFRVGNYR